MFPPAHGHNPIYLSVQFLNTVLSQRGPGAVPYSEDVKWFVRQHLMALVQEFPSFQVKTAVFTHNDGRTTNLLQADGTIPIFFQFVSYNIPVVICLTEPYPRQPPLVYVNPTRDMVVKPGHPHVDPSGVVSIPYLRGWIFPSSNLIDLARNMSHLFGYDPPLYTGHSSSRIDSTPRGSSSSLVGRTSPPQPRPSPSTSSASSFGSEYPPPATRPTPFGGRPVPPPKFNAEDQDELPWRNLITELVEGLHSDALALRNSREDQMDSLVKAQPVLKQRQRDLDEGLREMLDEKEGLEQLLQIVLTNTDVLETWVKENCEEKKNSEIEIDDVFEPWDVLSRQMLEYTAADLAIEDSIYSLDKAMTDGVIKFDAYMRNLRALAREQFFHRAMSAKVRTTQTQAQIASMASRAAPYRV